MELNAINTFPEKDVDKDELKTKFNKLVKQIGELQLKLYAEEEKSLLVILQGMDASGKDGAIKNVFEDVNPMGCHVICFKKPTEKEYSHDFLWRIHQQMPPKGMIHIFNRSHYEDILVPTVEGFINKNEIDKRYQQINNFEQMLTANNTTILKFMLHVSPEEQKERLLERITNPEKYWKHKDSDWDTRSKWELYQNVYNDIFKKCNVIPWHVIPSDKNWYKEYLIAEKVYETLNSLNPKYPALETNFEKSKYFST